MKWRVEPLMLAALATAPAAAQDRPPAGAVPRAASNEGQRHDAVGYAGSSDLPSGVALSALPVGSYVEVTSLDNGRTAVFAVTGTRATRPGEPVALSADAIRQLGMAGPGGAVRVRAASPSPPEVAALRAGEPASPRLDAPQVLLVGLRKDLPARGTASPVAPTRPVPQPASVAPAAPVTPAPVARAASVPKPPPAPVSRSAPRPVSGWGVQVAALSSESRARELAGRIGGTARAAGNVWRVQLGPFADRAAATAARADIVRRGHPQAALVHIP